MFKFEHLSKNYGKKVILSDISITIPDGIAVGILGLNGSGKSTLLSLIAAKEISELTDSIGYVPQENPLFQELKPMDNLRMWCKLSKKEIEARLGEEPLVNLGILDFMDTPVKKMSGGMKKRLSLATVLINNPKLLLLDEPFAALDLPAKEGILSYMKDFISANNSILVASHDEHIFEFCDIVYLLKNGQLFDTAKMLEQGVRFVDMLKEEA